MRTGESLSWLRVWSVGFNQMFGEAVKSECSVVPLWVGLPSQHKEYRHKVLSTTCIWSLQSKSFRFLDLVVSVACFV